MAELSVAVREQLEPSRLGEFRQPDYRDQCHNERVRPDHSRLITAILPRANAALTRPAFCVPPEELNVVRKASSKGALEASHAGCHSSNQARHSRRGLS